MKNTSLVGHSAEIFITVTESHQPADYLIDQFFKARKYLGAHDRRFIAEACYGMLRHKRLIETAAQQLYSDAPENMDSQDITPDVNKNKAVIDCLIYLVLAQKDDKDAVLSEVFDSIGFTQKSPKEFSDAVRSVLLKCEQNADSIQQLGVLLSFSDWMMKRFVDTYGKEQAKSLCETLNTPAPITLRINTLRTTLSDVESILAQNGIPSVKTALSPFGLQLEKRLNIFQLEIFKKGFFEMQDEGSQLLALLVDPKPGSKVVDACAGAGGKSLALAALMKNRGEIFALDVHTRRLDELRKRIKRAGTDTIRVRAVTENSHEEQLVDAMDYVLVDVPCSGTGTIRRNPGMKWSVTKEMIDELTVKQIQILNHNARYVRKGGRLIYATCSLFPEENEGIVEAFLKANAGFTLVPPADILQRYNLAILSRNEYFRLLPHEHGTDGFFAAVMERKI